MIRYIAPYCSASSWRRATQGRPLLRVLAEHESGALVRLFSRSAALCLAIAILAASEAHAADPPWLTDLPAAATQAQKQGKLLLVVQHSGDFTADSTAAKEARLYQTVALADRTVADLLGERFVVVCQAVGPSARVRPVAVSKAARAPAAAAPVVLTYVCLPDQRVLHFIPGFSSSAELLAELTWVERAYSELAKSSDYEAGIALRKGHLKQVPASDQALFTSQFPSLWHEGTLRDGPSTVDLPQTMKAARATLGRSLAGRVSAGSNRQALVALAAHGSMGVELAHLVLTEFPLVDLADLSRPAFEACAERRMWIASARSDELARWWDDSLAGGRDVLLVIGDDPFAASATDDERAPFVWPPKAIAAAAGLDRVSSRIVSIDELAQLLADAELDPVTYSAADGPPRFLIYSGGATKPAVRITRSEGTTRLTQALATLKSRALEVKVAAGGADDERD